MQVWSVLSVMGVIELGGRLSGIMRKFCFSQENTIRQVYTLHTDIMIMIWIPSLCFFFVTVDGWRSAGLSISGSFQPPPVFLRSASKCSQKVETEIYNLRTSTPNHPLQCFIYWWVWSTIHILQGKCPFRKWLFVTIRPQDIYNL